DRVKAARGGVKKYASNGNVYGVPELINTFGSDVVAKVVKWLDYKPSPQSSPQPSPQPSPQSAPSPAPPPRTLVEVHGVFQTWLGDDYDIDALDITCAAGACARLTGDPLWLLNVSGSGAAKTETVQSLAGAGAQVTSTIASEGALLSATSTKNKVKNATGGLLRTLKPSSGAVLVIKDFTSIISPERNVRSAVVAALGEIYDGRLGRGVGVDGGQPRVGEGRVIVVGACTPAWDTAHSVISLMGDRFVILRIDSTKHRHDFGRRAIRN